MDKSTIDGLIRSDFPQLNIDVDIDDRNVVTLSGECESWQQLIDVGHMVAQMEGIKNAVSNMTVRGICCLPSGNFC